MVEWLAWSLLLPLLAVAAVLYLRAQEARRLTAERIGYRLEFPQGLQAAAVVRCLVGLSGLLGSPSRRWLGMEALAFEVRAESGTITHRLLVPARLSEAVIGQLRAALPDVRLTPEPAQSADWLPWCLVRELRLPPGSLLRTDQPEAVNAALLGALQPLAVGERACIQWVIRPDAPRHRLSDYRPISLFPLWQRPPEAEAEQRRERQRKLAEPLFLAIGRVGVAAHRPERVQALMRRLLGAHWSLNAPGSTLRVRRWPVGQQAHHLEQARVPLLHWPAVLNAAELACLLALPVGAARLPGLTLGGCRQLAPSPLIPRTGRVLARATYPGEDRPLAIAQADRLRHLWALGPTGSGKSTLLLNLITQDMQAGTGVVVIDPVGDLVDNCLDRVPASRVQDVIVLDPTDDSGRILGLNPLAGGDPELVTDQVVGIFHHLYAAFWGPRSDDILRGAIGTLVRQPVPYTLCEVPRLLTDAAWRRQLVGALDDPIGLEAFWASYEAWKPGEQTAAIGPVLNKLRALTTRRRIRHLVGQAKGLDLADVLAENKLLFVPLRKGVLGEETAALLGALLLSRLWQAVQGRVSLPTNQRRPVMAYLDEFQDYLALPTNLATVLAQARALGLGLTLAHQHLGQLPREVRTAVLANARSKVIFATSADDARTLAREFAPHLAAEDLQGLGPYEVALSIAVAGQVAPPATGVTYPPGGPTGQAAAARAYSQARYGTPAVEVEAAIRARHAVGVASGPIGRTRRQP